MCKNVINRKVIVKDRIVIVDCGSFIKLNNGCNVVFIVDFFN